MNFMPAEEKPKLFMNSDFCWQCGKDFVRGGGGSFLNSELTQRGDRNNGKTKR